MRPAAGNLHLGAVMTGPNGGLAVINGRTVTIGDTVRGAKVVRIQPVCVDLEINGERFQLKLGGPSGLTPSR